MKKILSVFSALLIITAAVAAYAADIAALDKVTILMPREKVRPFWGSCPENGNGRWFDRRDLLYSRCPAPDSGRMYLRFEKYRRRTVVCFSGNTADRLSSV